MRLHALALFAAIAAAVSMAACSSDPRTLGPASGDVGGDDDSTPGSGSKKEPNKPAENNGTPPSTTPPVTTPPTTTPPDNNTPPPGVTDNKAKAYFISTVLPSLATTCGSCHAPPGSAGAPVFLQTNASEAYATVEGRGYIMPNSMLIRKGAHVGPALTTQQMGLVNQWLQFEVEVRGTATPVNLLAKLGSCVDDAKFNAIGQQNLRTVRRQGENANNCNNGCNQELCQTCHKTGEAGFHSNFQGLGDRTLAVLKANGTSPQGAYLISKYITTNGTQLVPSPALKDKAAVTATAAPYDHPMYRVTPEMDAAIQAFANDIITKYNAKTCGQ